jgi:hypothetical protein
VPDLTPEPPASPPGLDPAGLFAQLQQVQASMHAAQGELADTIVDGVAGGGLVRAQVRGTGELVGITIAPEAVDPDDVEMLEDLIVAAVHDAARTAAALQAERLGRMTGGLDLGELFGGPA